MGLTVTLVAAIEKDINEHEIGAVIRHGLDHPAVRSVVFQPVTHSGRHVEFDPLTRLTNSDVLHAIGKQVSSPSRASAAPAGVPGHPPERTARLRAAV